MREGLKKLNGIRKKFRAVVGRLGKKANYLGYSDDTVLLKNIVDLEVNSVVADHLWFTFSKAFDKANVKEGSVIEFDARIKEYSKGYVNKRYKVDHRKADFKLSYPTNIRVIN